MRCDAKVEEEEEEESLEGGDVETFLGFGDGEKVLFTGNLSSTTCNFLSRLAGCGGNPFPWGLSLPLLLTWP